MTQKPAWVMDSRLTDLSRRLATFTDDENLRGLVDYAFGAVYALARAVKSGFKDRPSPLPDIYWQEVKRRCLHASKGHLPQPGEWVGGFYFNSALVRIDAVRDKLEDKLYKGRFSATDAVKVVQQEVNRLKHDLEATVDQRQVDVDRATTALADLVATLEAEKASRSERSGRIAASETTGRIRS